MPRNGVPDAQEKSFVFLYVWCRAENPKDECFGFLRRESTVDGVRESNNRRGTLFIRKRT